MKNAPTITYLKERLLWTENKIENYQLPDAYCAENPLGLPNHCHLCHWVLIRIKQLTNSAQNYRQQIKFAKSLVKKKTKEKSQYHYAITLTTKSAPFKELVHRFHNFLHTKSIWQNLIKVHFCCEKSKIIHLHAYVQTHRYIEARDVYRKNNNERVDVKLLNGLARIKWLNYMKKTDTKEFVPKQFLFQEYNLEKKIIKSVINNVISL